MKFLVGLSPDKAGQEALALGAVLANSSKGTLVAATIIPETWGPPSPARVDGEYGIYLRQRTTKMQAKCKAGLSLDAAVEFLIIPAPSTGAGLLQAAKQAAADCLVIGSSRRAPMGLFAEGSVGSGILHASDIPVAVAPRGYSPVRQTRLQRLSCAFKAAPSSHDLARRCLEWCKAFDVPMRLLTAVVRDRQLFPTGAGYDVENIIANQWRDEARLAQRELAAQLQGPTPVTTEIADKRTWRSALASTSWLDAEMLVIGSSQLGPLLGVFLGARSRSIISNAPVPCLMLPRKGKGLSDPGPQHP